MGKDKVLRPREMSDELLIQERVREFNTHVSEGDIVLVNQQFALRRINATCCMDCEMKMEVPTADVLRDDPEIMIIESGQNSEEAIESKEVA